MTSTGVTQSPPRPAVSNRNSYDTFVFPKFGDLPGSFLSNGAPARTSSQTRISTANGTSPVRQTSGSTISPTSSNPFGAPQTASPASFERMSSTNLNELTGLFSPEVLETASRSGSTDYGFSNPSTATSIKNGSFSNPPKPHRASSTSTINSPASSMRFDSSVGTTPEPTGDSPSANISDSQKPDPVLNTINEENTTNAAAVKHRQQLNDALFSPEQQNKTSSNSNNGIDWMAQQNGGTFDPVLFGDYRDPQDNILSNLTDDFFNDAFPPSQDFSSPYNTGYIETPAEPKHDLMSEIEKTQNEDKEDCQKYLDREGVWYVECAGGRAAVRWEGCGQILLTALRPPFNDEIFANDDVIVSRNRVKEATPHDKSEKDMDELCSELRNKARCKETGKIMTDKVDNILDEKKKTHTPDGNPKADGIGVGGLFGSFI